VGHKQGQHRLHILERMLVLEHKLGQPLLGHMMGHRLGQLGHRILEHRLERPLVVERMMGRTGRLEHKQGQHRLHMMERKLVLEHKLGVVVGHMMEHKLGQLEHHILEHKLEPVGSS